MRVVWEDVEGGGEGLLVDALGVVFGGEAALLLLPAEAHRVHLQHRLDVDLEWHEVASSGKKKKIAILLLLYS